MGAESADCQGLVEQQVSAVKSGAEREAGVALDPVEMVAQVAMVVLELTPPSEWLVVPEDRQLRIAALEVAVEAPEVTVLADRTTTKDPTEQADLDFGPTIRDAERGCLTQRWSSSSLPV
jgi:hypothetical protein